MVKVVVPEGKEWRVGRAGHRTIFYYHPLEPILLDYQVLH